MLSLWSKFAWLSGIFHHRNQINKKLQNRDRRTLKESFLLGGSENQPPFDLEILAFGIMMRLLKDPFSVDTGGNFAVTAMQHIPPLDVDDKFQ